jgi:hypothetical protein
MGTREIILGLLLFFPAVLAAGLIAIKYASLKTLFWRRAAGRILTSRSAARDIRNTKHSMQGSGASAEFTSQETIQRRNFAVIRYGFQAEGKSWRAERVSLGADSGDFEVVETLRRYPEGKTVSVLYNPKDPNDCILERPPAGKILMAWLGVALLVGLIFGGVYGVDSFAGLVRSAIPRPERTPLVVFCAGFALAMAAAAIAIAKKGREMRAWPRAEGEIVQSSVAETRREESHSQSSRTRVITMYAPRVVYQFKVGDNVFQGDNVGMISASSNPKGPQKFAARYPLRSRVAVFYDRENPTDSTLNPGVLWLPLLFWAFAALSLAVAVMAAGFGPRL